MAEKNATREFLVVLKILTDDPEEDMRNYPYEDALMAPPGDPQRFVSVKSAVEVKR